MSARPPAWLILATAAAVGASACVLPKRKADPLDRISGTEDWKEVTAGSRLDREWQGWYRGKVAWRRARREARLQRARSLKLAEMLQRASVLDAAAVRRVIRSKPRGAKRGLSFDEGSLFDTPKRASSRRREPEPRPRRRRRRRRPRAEPPPRGSDWRQVPVERLDDTSPGIRQERTPAEDL